MDVRRDARKPASLGMEIAGFPGGSSARTGAGWREAVQPRYAVNELPQPHPPVALGFENVKPEPCMDDT